MQMLYFSMSKVSITFNGFAKMNTFLLFKKNNYKWCTLMMLHALTFNKLVVCHHGFYYGKNDMLGCIFMPFSFLFFFLLPVICMLYTSSCSQSTFLYCIVLTANIALELNTACSALRSAYILHKSQRIKTITTAQIGRLTSSSYILH